MQAGPSSGVKAALFYLAAYTFLVAGSFGVVTVVEPQGRHRAWPSTTSAACRATARLLALVFSLFLFAQAGVPLTSGFFAKFYVVNAAIDAGSTGLAIIAMVTAVVAAFLYLRIIVSMYMTSDEELPEPRTIPIPFGAGLALALSPGRHPRRRHLPEPARPTRPATPPPCSSSSRSPPSKSRSPAPTP